MIGASITWLNAPPDPPASPIIKDGLEPMLSADERLVMDALRVAKDTGDGSMWQKRLVQRCGFSDSKASRGPLQMERAGLIRRVRDGMSKRVELAGGGTGQ